MAQLNFDYRSVKDSLPLSDGKFHSYETGKSYDIVRWMDIGIWWNIPKV